MFLIYDMVLSYGSSFYSYFLFSLFLISNLVIVCISYSLPLTSAWFAFAVFYLFLNCLYHSAVISSTPIWTWV